jgi:hypothetical protein
MSAHLAPSLRDRRCRFILSREEGVVGVGFLL